MADYAAIPFFTDSWKADTDHLTRVERDIYLCLLILIWRTPGCRVPNELPWISRKLGLTPEEVPLLVALLLEFTQTDGNWITQKRLSKEFAYVQRTSKKQSDNAKARWDKEKPTSQRNAEWHASGNAPSPSPSPTVRKEEPTVLPKEKRGSRLDADFVPDQSCTDLATKLGFTRMQAQEALENFTDYWKGAAGAKGVKLDWQATFRNWLRNDRNRKGPINGKGPPHKPGSMADGFAKVRAVIDERERRELAGVGEIGEADDGGVP